MKSTTNSVFEQIKENKVVRHLQQRGDQIYFSLYGTNCVLMFRNDYYYLGAQLVKSKADTLELEQLAEILLVLVEDASDVVELGLFISEKDFPFVFMRQQKNSFSVDGWEKGFERLLIANSILKKLLTKKQQDPSQKYAVKKHWIPM